MGEGRQTRECRVGPPYEYGGASSPHPPLSLSFTSPCENFRTIPSSSGRCVPHGEMQERARQARGRVGAKAKTARKGRHRGAAGGRAKVGKEGLTAVKAWGRGVEGGRRGRIVPFPGKEEVLFLALFRAKNGALSRVRWKGVTQRAPEARGVAEQAGRGRRGEGGAVRLHAAAVQRGARRPGGPE